MTSERKIKANRANARASTGPKTAQGRTRSGRNALGHALSLPVYSDPALSEEVESLAREIAGPAANVEIQDLARRVAEAQIDLRRVRDARFRSLSDALNEPYSDSRAATRKKAAIIGSLPGMNAPEMSDAALLRLLLTPTLEEPQKFATFLSNEAKQLEEPQKFATILSHQAKQLLAIDRYERRALSRRKFAIRAIDEARSRGHNDCKSILYNY